MTESKGKYQNKYVKKENYGELHIFGGKHSAIILFDLDDFERISSVNWGLQAIGKVGYKIVYPYTIVQRKCILMGKWLLNIKKPGQKVEHRNNNQTDFRRDNLYVISRGDAKKKDKPRKGKETPCGIFEVTQKKGNVTGYKVLYREGGQQKVSYFSKYKLNGLENALEQAKKFRDTMIAEEKM